MSRTRILIFLPIIPLLALLINGCEDLFPDNSDVTDEERKQYLAPQHSLAWSPDSSMIAFISTNKLLIMDVATENQRQLTGTGYYDEPTWSPDSVKIAYISSPMDYRSSVWTKSADGSDVSKQITSNKTSDYRPRWSPDGTKIAFHSRRTSNTDLWLINFDGSGEEQVVATDPAVDQDAEWSPDSTRLAFESLRSGNYDIWTARIDGSTAPLQITTDTGADTNPMWSPDGSRIAFQSDRGETRGIWVKNSDGTGSDIEVSAGLTVAAMQDWSPDSKMIAFVSNQIIYVVKSDGTSDATKIAEGVEPRWSPDGTKMVYVSWKEDNYKVTVIDLPSELRASP